LNAAGAAIPERRPYFSKCTWRSYSSFLYESARFIF
jgi:hypothetical protein